VTTTQSYAAFASQAKEATEKSVAAFTLAVHPPTAAATGYAEVPKAVVEPVQRYIQFVQQTARVNVDLATKWTQLVAAFSGVLAFSGVTALSGVTGARVAELADAAVEPVESVSEAVSETNVDLAVTAGSTAEPTAPDQSDEAAESEPDAELEAERAEAKHAHELAREPYRSLTKAELSALLDERGLPKTGTIATLVERLVSADSQS